MQVLQLRVRLLLRWVTVLRLVESVSDMVNVVVVFPLSVTIYELH